MEKKNVVLLSVIAVATLLITVIGATFAWYAATVSQEDVDEVDIKAADALDNLAITYDDGDAISVNNIIPGWNTNPEAIDTNGQKTITVTNNGDITLKYTIDWYNVSNGFYEKSDGANFKYSVSASGTKQTDFTAINTEKEAPHDASTPFAQDIEIKPSEVQTYVITFKYLNANSIQDTQGASFSAQFILGSDIQTVYTASE